MLSSSNLNAESASLDGMLCTTPSSPKNNFVGDNNSFNYNTILDGDNIK